MSEIVLFMRSDRGIVAIRCKVLEDFKNGCLKIMLGNAVATALPGTWLKIEHTPPEHLKEPNEVGQENW